MTTPNLPTKCVTCGTTYPAHAIHVCQGAPVITANVAAGIVNPNSTAPAPLGNAPYYNTVPMPTFPSMTKCSVCLAHVEQADQWQHTNFHTSLSMALTNALQRLTSLEGELSGFEEDVTGTSS